MATSPDALGATLTALADPSRRALLQRLAHGPATSGQLAELLPMSRPATSQHLRVLADAGLMTTTVRGRHHWHELSTTRLAEIEHWTRTLIDTWTAAPPLTTRPSQLRALPKPAEPSKPATPPRPGPLPPIESGIPGAPSVEAGTPAPHAVPTLQPTLQPTPQTGPAPHPTTRTRTQPPPTGPVRPAASGASGALAADAESST